MEVSFGPGRAHEDYRPMGNNRFRIWINGSAQPLTFFADADDAAACRVTARKVQTMVGSQAANNRIRQWLRQCVDHEACFNMSLREFPTRVIDVEPGDGKSTSRLVTAPQMGESYVALSYCWGGGQQGQTLQSNLADRMDSIDERTLSKSVQHAISVTRGIGFRYLWVDSICIIQDSQHDMNQQLARMSEVYQNAYVTILAANAASAADGFLEERAAQSTDATIPFWAKDDQLGSAHVRCEGPYWTRHEPIVSRAWTFQESWLSPRLVIFASHTLQYHCSAQYVNWGDSLNMPTGSFINHLSRATLLASSKPTGQQIPSWVNMWMSVLTEYTGRELRYQTDRLLALSGLAKVFYSSHGFDYAVGLWTGPWFSIFLLWQPGDYAETVLEDYAPSWSWTSVSNPISYRYGLYSYPSRAYTSLGILAECNLRDGNLPFGRVTAASLRVKAKLREGRYIAPDKLVWGTDVIDPQQSRAISASLDYRLDCNEIAVLCMPLLEQYGKHSTTSIEAVHGLLLAQSSDGSYHARIGVFFGAAERDFEQIHSRDIELR